VALTNLPHREMVYRMAYQLGRHVIGYEVQKVLAAVDWFTRRSPRTKVGVFGYGEGGLIALYSAAADTRIDAVAVSGYFAPRLELWKEPPYRNVWGLLEEFGDAELARLIAPRSLVVEACRGPEVSGPTQARAGRSGNAAPGSLSTPALAAVEGEVARARPVFDRLNAGDRLALSVSGGGTGEPGSDPALGSFLRSLGRAGGLRPSGTAPRDQRPRFDPMARQHRQYNQLVEFSQKLLRQSEFVRQKFWSKADTSSPEKWNASAEPYRRLFWEEITGRFPAASEPLAARTRRLWDEPKWTGYEVVLPVWPDVFAYGILLLPKDVRSGERRPVAVCQHGVNHRAQDVSDPNLKNIYHNFGARLADRGFVVYAPQNPYVGEPEFPFRLLQRKANPIQRSIFSVILGQHERTLDWLGGLPFVDPARIGFYGLSYGGETALRVPPLLKRYALSISSGNFTEWAWKTARYDHASAFLYRGGYDHYDFNILNTFNDAELAQMMAPRPFMVERGHRDVVSPDEWVAYEYAKVRRHYAFLGLPDRTLIEFFNGVHEIHSTGTFEFLHRHLNWPAPSPGRP
jgi:dienelactone hydrolase